MRSYLNTPPRSTLDDLARHATSTGALQNGTDIHAKKNSNYCWNTKHRRDRQWDSPHKINALKKGGWRPKSTAAPTDYVSAVMQFECNLQSICTRATPGTNGISTTYVISALFCTMCREKSHRQAQCLFIPNHLRQRFAGQSENILKNLSPRWQKKLGYQPASALSRKTATNARTTSIRADHATSIYPIGELTLGNVGAEDFRTLISPINSRPYGNSFSF